KSRAEPIGDVTLAPGDRLDTLRVHPRDAGGESGDANHVGRAALEAARQVRGHARFARIAGATGPNACDPGALVALHLRLGAGTHPQRTGPRRTHEPLVTGKGHEIGAETME